MEKQCSTKNASTCYLTSAYFGTALLLFTLWLHEGRAWQSEHYRQKFTVLLDFGLFGFFPAFIYALAPSFTVKRIFCLLIIQMLLYILQLSYRLHRPGGGSRCPDLLLTSLLRTACHMTAVTFLLRILLTAKILSCPV